MNKMGQQYYKKINFRGGEEEQMMFDNCLDAENEFERCWNNTNYT